MESFMAPKKKNILLAYISPILVLLIIPVVHYGYRYISLNAEVKGFTYAAYVQSLGEYPQDKQLDSMVRFAMIDGDITGKESVSISDYLIEMYGFYKSAPINDDHSDGKSNLIAILK
jgi:hypothetical protein